MDSHELDVERNKAVRWTAWSAAAAALSVPLTLPLAWPLGMALAGGGIDIHWWRAAIAYFSELPFRLDHWAARHWEWFAASDIPPWPLIAPFAIAAAIAGVLAAVNPHRFARASHGSARMAATRDLRKGQLLDECGYVFGRWGSSPSRGPLIRSYECLSMGVIAPPGTGKTVLLISNILVDHPDRGTRVPGPSMIVNDPKGEMCRITAGWRSRLGPVFRVAWGEAEGKRWNPLSPRNFPGSERAPQLRRDIIAVLEAVYARPVEAFTELFVAMRDQDGWRRSILAEPSTLGPPKDAHDKVARSSRVAPFGRADNGVARSPDRSPGQASRDSRELARALDLAVELSVIYSEREKMIDSSCAVMVSDKVGVHWCTTGRSALAGFMLYEIARAEREDREPTIGRMLDWLSTSTVAGAYSKNLAPTQRPDAEASNADLAEAAAYLGTAESPTGGEANNDRVAKMLEEAIAEAQKYGYPARVISELGALLIKPEKERGSVISTAAGALGIFKNAAVRRATSRSDFSFDDLRGAFRSAKNPRGFPVTLYIVTKLKDAESLGLVTGLLIDQAAGYLISQDDAEVRRSMRPVWVMADEFWTLPKGMTSIPQIPALGRSYWVSLMLVGQSWGQVAIQMGREAVEVLKGALNYTVLFTQNDRTSAEDASRTIGNATVRQSSVSKTRGLGKNINPFQSNVSISTTGHPLMRPEDLMSMEKLDPKKGTWGKLVFLNVGMKNRPILCRPPIYFLDPLMKKRIDLSVRTWPDLNAGGLGADRSKQDAVAAMFERRD